MTIRQWVTLGACIVEQLVRELVKPKAPPPAPSHPWSHKTVDHVEAQIKAGARKFDAK